MPEEEIAIHLCAAALRILIQQARAAGVQVELIWSYKGVYARTPNNATIMDPK